MVLGVEIKTKTDTTNTKTKTNFEITQWITLPCLSAN
jgi:hypothetical protein